jgi:hypothetical protein
MWLSGSEKNKACGNNSVQLSTIVLSKKTLAAEQWRFMAELIASMERMV